MYLQYLILAIIWFFTQNNYLPCKILVCCLQAKNLANSAKI